MIKLNIQLFASDVVRGDDFTLTAKTSFFANGNGYKSRITITHEDALTNIFTKEDLKNNFSSFVLMKDKVQVMDLLTDNNYIITEGADSKGVIYIDILDNGTYTIAANSKPGDDDYATITVYSSNSCSVSGITDSRTDTTKTIQKTTEIVTQQASEPEKVGVIKMFSGSVPPLGWLLCDGAAISRTKYSKLFSVIGTTYGSGDGETTFNLPNLKGKTVVGLDNTDSDFGVLGKTGGEKAHKLTLEEMPKHFHGNKYTFNDTSGSGWSYRVRNGASEGTTDGTSDGYAGGNAFHNNLQPYIVLNYIIKVVETKNLQAQVVDSLEGDSTSTSPSIRAVKSAISAHYDSTPLGTVLDYEGTEIPEGYEKVDDEDDFSLDERKVGVWHNGKPIYSKTITGTKAGAFALPSTIDEAWIDMANSYQKRYVSDSDIRICPLLINQVSSQATSNPALADQQVGAYINIKDKTLRIEVGASVTSQGFVATVRYTKTTD